MTGETRTRRCECTHTGTGGVVYWNGGCRRCSVAAVVVVVVVLAVALRFRRTAKRIIANNTLPEDAHGPAPPSVRENGTAGKSKTKRPEFAMCAFCCRCLRAVACVVDRSDSYALVQNFTVRQGYVVTDGRRRGGEKRTTRCDDCDGVCVRR